MDTTMIAMLGMANRGNEPRVFDWYKAAEIIRDRQPDMAVAGLMEDMGCTADIIWDDDKPVNGGYTYLSSVWATPVIVLDNEIMIECWKFQSEVPEWNEYTVWPDSALAIVGD